MVRSTDEIRQNYKDLFEYSSDYIFILEVNGKILDVNHTFLQNFKYYSSKIFHTNIYEYLVSQDDYHDLDLNTQLLQYKSAEDPLIYKFKKKENLPVFLKIDKIPIKKNKKIIAFLGIGHDITKEIKTDIPLYESLTHKEGLEEIINQSPVVAILLKNSDRLSIEFISDNISQFGYESSDFLAGELHYFDIIYPDDLEGMKKKLMQQSKENDNQFTHEYRIITKNGQIRWIDNRIWIKRNDKGVITHYQGIVLDITEKKIAVLKLKESEEKFRNLFKGSPNFTLAWQKVNDDFILVDYNDLAEQATKGDIKKRIGQTAYFTYVEELNRPDLVENLNYCLKNKLSYSKTIQRYVIFLDDIRDLRIKYSYILPDLVCIHIKDITEKLRAEQRLKKSEQEYRNAYERENFYKDLFAHDMRNILQGMLSSLDLCDILVMSPNKFDDFPDLLNILREQVQRGSNLVRNVRKFSELQDTDIKMKSMIIKELLEKAINMVKKSSLFKTINFQIESYDDNLMINADEFLLDVFENILFNAVKHNEHSIIEIFIKLSELQEKNKKYLKIEFMDNGYGVENSRKQSIFKRGYKEDRSVAGIGLGLSLVYNILNRYSAKIWVENRVPEDFSQGSNFIIQFPLI